jgi:Ca2+-binding EF-hand superfamily protein
MRKLTLSLMAAAAAVTAGTALAQPAPVQPRQPLTRVAVEQRADKAFDRLDANRDGKIDPADRAARQKSRFDRIDADHDGQVSYTEFAAMQERRDGVRKDRVVHRGERGGRLNRHGEHRMAMHGHRGDAIGMVRLADGNRDGGITRAEFQSAALKRFERLDADKNGTVTRDEAKAARDNMRQRWQSRRQARQG